MEFGMNALLAGCLSLVKTTADGDAPSSYCPAYYDGFRCWPATPPGTVTSLPCPDMEGFDPQRQVTATCMADGQWDTKYDAMWHYYRVCFRVRTRRSVTPAVDQDKITREHNYGDIFADDKLRLVFLSLDSASIGLLMLAAFVWALIWYKSRLFKMYRLVLFISVVMASTIGHTASIVYRAATFVNTTSCRVATEFSWLSDLTLYSLLLAYVLVNAVMWRNTIRLNYQRLVFPFLLVLLTPLVCVLFQVMFDIPQEAPSSSSPAGYYGRCHFNLAVAHRGFIHWLFLGVKLLFLGLALSMAFGLVMCIVCGNRRVRHTYDELIFHRHSNLLLLTALVYCATYEVAAVVWPFAPSSFDLVPLVEGFRSARGVILAVLLFLFDLEVIRKVSNISNCCSCPGRKSDALESKPLREMTVVEANAESDDVKPDVKTFRSTKTLTLSSGGGNSSGGGFGVKGHNNYGAVDEDE